MSQSERWFIQSPPEDEWKSYEWTLEVGQNQGYRAVVDEQMLIIAHALYISTVEGLEGRADFVVTSSLFQGFLRCIQ